MRVLQSTSERIARLDAPRRRAIVFALVACGAPLVALAAGLPTLHAIEPVTIGALITAAGSLCLLIQLLVEDAAQSTGCEGSDVAASPANSLAARDHLISIMSADLSDRPGAPAMLGLIRVANHDHLLAFDPTAAATLISALNERLVTATGGGRPLALVDRDCFAVWFGPGLAPKQAAAELQALGYVLMQDIEIGGCTATPDIQLGSAFHPLDADEPGNLLNRAFVSLARPQRAADGSIAFFSRPSAEAARKRFSLEQDLRHAIRRNELILHYQPIVDLASGRVAGAEALLRWRSGSHEWAKPSDVVSVLEESGLVHEVGLWTLNTVCRQLRAWGKRGSRNSGWRSISLPINCATPAYRWLSRAFLRLMRCRPARSNSSLLKPPLWKTPRVPMRFFKRCGMRAFLCRSTISAAAIPAFPICDGCLFRN